ncbi:MAG: glycosyltransferase [bacterium]
MKTISLVVPFYNEGDTVLDFLKKILPIINNIKQYTFELVCVDDGSNDDTFANLLKIKDDRLKIIQLSRNFDKATFFL